MTQTTLRGVVDGLKAEIQMVDSTYVLSIEEVPTLLEAYPRLGQETAEDPFEPIKATCSPKDSDKAIYLHSSGSTGLPKPIPLTHKIVMGTASLCEPFQTSSIPC
jgi:acyl-coenzyme A synthetase/AMP-(fatty) acid ligase